METFWEFYAARFCMCYLSWHKIQGVNCYINLEVANTVEVVMYHKELLKEDRMESPWCGHVAESQVSLPVSYKRGLGSWQFHYLALFLFARIFCTLRLLHWHLCCHIFSQFPLYYWKNVRENYKFTLLSIPSAFYVTVFEDRTLKM